MMDNGALQNRTKSSSHETPLQRAIRKSYSESLTHLQFSEIEISEDALDNSPKTYEIYHPMLLLSAKWNNSQRWMKFFDDLEETKIGPGHFYPSLASIMKVTHIAIDAPIPAMKQDDTLQRKERVSENVIRSPINLKPLHGDFGPLLPPYPEHTPTNKDFARAFWVKTKQNGIFQVWAPLYTMFSSGNVTEKSRILELVKSQDVSGAISVDDTTAVDLFAGVGYFAFSYAKGGIAKVLCWDLNPWSTEGLRKGALANKWSVQVFSKSDLERDTEELKSKIHAASRNEEKLVVFTESNTSAISRIQSMRHSIPHIRHVNCGMLPTSSSSWKTAIEAIDPFTGGWIHLHETSFERDFHNRPMEIMELVQNYFQTIDEVVHSSSTGVQLEKFTKVKSVAPRLWHIVLDIWIPARSKLL